MSWAVDIDPARNSAEQDNPAAGKKYSLSASDQEDRGSYNDSSNDGQSEQGSILDGQRPGKIVIPTAKQIRKATIEGIKLGVLPEYQDYTVVLAYLVKEFIAYDFDFCEVQSRVPWFSEWISNSFNEATLDKELELAARLEASRIYDRIQFLVEGGICTKTVGRIAGLCYCLPICRIGCRVKAYCLDLLLSCVWSTCFDWWLGRFCRMYIIFYICYVPARIKMKVEELLFGGDTFEDEELGIRNIYDSNSYRIANQYACMMLLSILLTLLGICITIVSYIYLPLHPDQQFVKVEAMLGIFMLASGCFGLQFFCRCTV